MSHAEVLEASALNLFPVALPGPRSHDKVGQSSACGTSCFSIPSSWDNLIVSPGKFLRYLDRLQPLALFFVRLALGVIMVSHGYQKVFGGLHHHAQFVASLGLPAWTAYLSAFTEFFGGLLVLVGLFTRVAAFAICINLGVAIWRVHWHNGLIGNGGFEFPLAVATLAFALIFFGGGAIALDHVLRGGGSSFKRQ